MSGLGTRGIDSALVVGAGAVGSVVAATMHGKMPGSIRLLASPAREKRLRAGGLVVNGTRIDLPLAPSSVPPGPGEAPGLIVVAVKGYQLDEAIAEMAPYVGDGTTIISLLNGISSEDALAAAFGRDKVLYAMILGIDAVREGNSTSYSVTGAVHFGEARNPAGAWSPRVLAVASFFERAGVAYSVPEDMIRSMWYKLMINVGVNQASAVTGGCYGLFGALPEARSLMESSMRELVAISKAMGTGLVEADIAAWYRTLATLSPDGKTSMLQDIEAGRATELDLFAGEVIRLGERAGVPTPVNRTLYDIIRTLEARRGDPDEDGGLLGRRRGPVDRHE